MSLKSCNEKAFEIQKTVTTVHLMKNNVIFVSYKPSQSNNSPYSNTNYLSPDKDTCLKISDFLTKIQFKYEDPESRRRYDDDDRILYLDTDGNFKYGSRRHYGEGILEKRMI